MFVEQSKTLRVMRTVIALLFTLIPILNIIAQVNVAGTIYGNETPLAFATVTIKGSEKGSITDEVGHFTLSAETNDTLLISHVGFTAREIKVTHSNTLNIKLDNNNLEEVIVYAQNIKTEQKVIGGCKFHTIISCNAKAIGVRIENERNVQPEKIRAAFPNPTSSGYFDILLNETFHKVSVTISSMTGQIIGSKTTYDINQLKNLDISSYSPGVYVVNIIADGKPLKPLKVIKS